MSWKVFDRSGALLVSSSSGGGTVTSVSVISNQGLSGVVANPTTTPAITLSIGVLTGVTSYNGLVITANTGVITTGTWNATTVGILYGGTGATTANDALNNLLPSQGGNAGKALQTDGTNTSWVAVGSGSVTSVSVVSANGFAGTVATSTTTPAITLTTTITGVLKGNGTAISAATDADITSFLLTGYVSGAGVVAATDSILQAIQKLNGNIGALVTGVSSVSGTTNRITSTGGATPVIDISASYVGQISITTLGTITSGTWNAGVIGPTYGGTGLSAYTTGDLIQATASNTLSALVGVSAGSYLRSGGVGTANVWSTLKLPNTATSSYIPYATSANTIGESSLLKFDGTTFTGGGILTSAKTAGTYINQSASENTGTGNNRFALVLANETGAGGGANTYAGAIGFHYLGTVGAIPSSIFGALIESGAGQTNTYFAWYTRSSTSAVQPTERWRISAAGNFSNTGATGTAYIHLKAGTASASTAPLKFTSGTNLATPETGAMEYDGTNLYYTPTGTTRQTIAYLALAQTWTNTQVFQQVIYTVNAITAVANAATVPVTYRLNNVTNNSAAGLTITMTTASAVDGQLSMVRIYDFSAVAQTITWVNTENSTVTIPSTSNGSTTLFLTVGFIYNGATSKWRCIAKA